MYSQDVSQRGYFAIGIYEPKTEGNIGILMRSAFCFQADFIFTVGKRYTGHVADTTHTWKNIPLFHYKDINDLLEHMPAMCPLIGVELGEKSDDLPTYCHPERAIYLLGAEDYGLPKEVLAKCKNTIQIPFCSMCLNVSAAGSIIMYDRRQKRAKRRSELETRKLIKQWDIE